MLDKQTIEAIRTQVAPHEPPVLSLYVNVNPAEQGNQQKAHVLRARAALEGLALPDRVRDEEIGRARVGKEGRGGGGGQQRKEKRKTKKIAEEDKGKEE